MELPPTISKPAFLHLSLSLSKLGSNGLRAMEDKPKGF